MSYTAVKVENLGKRYRLGQQVGYKTLREALLIAYHTPTRVVGKAVRRWREGNRDSIRHQEPRSGDYIWALKDVSFDIKQGEAVGIIGRNGSGKSTLLKILSRITAPTEGYGEIRGRVGSLLEVGTGFHPELTGRENIYLNGAVIGMKRVEVDRKFDDIVAFAEIEKFLDTPVKRYSSGMYVRLAFAVAAHLEPDILLVDEVLAVGDASFQKKCLGKMGDVAKGGRTVLFVSHNMASIRRLCHRCVLVDKGRVVTDGSTDEAIARYSGSLESAGESTFEPDTSKIAQIIRVNVRNRDEEPSPRLEMDRPIVVTIDYEIREKLTHVGVACMMTSTEGIPLLSIEDHDLDPSLFVSERSPGQYRARFEIPGGLLNAGKYILRVSFGSSHISYDDREAFSFELLDTQGLLKWYRAGVLSPAFPWTTTRIG